MKKYRKKPVVIEAMQFTGSPKSAKAIYDWTKESGHVAVQEMPEGYSNKNGNPAPRYRVFIKTLEGIMQARPGDFIIRGVSGEFYPCKPNIFKRTYEKVEDKEAKV
jgi:hypothetical protein